MNRCMKIGLEVIKLEQDLARKHKVNEFHHISQKEANSRISCPLWE